METVTDGGTSKLVRQWVEYHVMTNILGSEGRDTLRYIEELKINKLILLIIYNTHQ